MLKIICFHTKYSDHNFLSSKSSRPSSHLYLPNSMSSSSLFKKQSNLIQQLRVYQKEEKTHFNLPFIYYFHELWIPHFWWIFLNSFFSLKFTLFNNTKNCCLDRLPVWQELYFIHLCLACSSVSGHSCSIHSLAFFYSDGPMSVGLFIFKAPLLHQMWLSQVIW